jgi:hypothetical protein
VKLVDLPPTATVVEPTSFSVDVGHRLADLADR